ncbi:uncharacterized [Tachysurus ichikawai]
MASFFLPLFSSEFTRSAKAYIWFGSSILASVTRVSSCSRVASEAEHPGRRSSFSKPDSDGTYCNGQYALKISLNPKFASNIEKPDCDDNALDWNLHKAKSRRGLQPCEVVMKIEQRDTAL